MTELRESQSERTDVFPCRARAGGDPSRGTVLVIDRDPSWYRPVAASAHSSGLRTVRDWEADPLRGAVGTLRLVLWNLRRVEQFDSELQRELLKEHPSVDFVVAVGEAAEDQIVQLLREGVTYLLDKNVGWECFCRSLLQLIRFEHKVRRSEKAIEVNYHVRNWVEITGPSQGKFVESLAEFAQVLTRTCLEERKRRSLAYALREVGQNAVEWGNANDPRKHIHMSFCILEDRVVVKLQDEGQGFDRSALPCPHADPFQVLTQRKQQGKRVGGYGLSIVQGLMDEVLFNERGNAVLLVLKLHRGCPGVSPKSPGAERKGK